MRFLLPAALAVALLTGFVTTEIGAAWSAHAPTLALLVVIILLLWRQQSRRDFYVVQHLGYDRLFKEHAGRHVSAERGPLVGGRNESFSDLGAAKAYFDRLEGMGSRNSIENVNHIYVVRGRKPPVSFPTDDKALGGVLIHTTPYSDICARREEACEEHRIGTENDQYEAVLRQHLSAGGEISDAPSPPWDEEHARKREQQRERLEKAERGCWTAD